MTDHKPLDTPATKLLKRAHALNNKAQTKQLYKDWAQTYDQTMVEDLGYLSPSKAAKLFASTVIDKKAHILDIGTGTGLVGMELSQRGYTNIDGLDYSASMLEQARKKNIYKHLITADLNKALTIDSEKYDALICIGTFTHGHVGADCLNELFRILKVGGHFITIIRTDYWESAGFSEKLDAYIKSGHIKTIFKQQDSNYTDSKHPESWLLAWEKCAL